LKTLSMGIIVKKLTFKEHRKAENSVELDFLIDSGAVYSLVPGRILDELGIDTYRTIDFALADGTVITRRVTSGYFEYNGEGGPAPVIYGEEGDEPLLGVTTLESLGLILHPFKRELLPMRMLLANLKFKP
jgi:aspartyl protease family protein